MKMSFEKAEEKSSSLQGEDLPSLFKQESNAGQEMVALAWQGIFFLLAAQISGEDGRKT